MEFLTSPTVTNFMNDTHELHRIYLSQSLIIYSMLFYSTIDYVLSKKLQGSYYIIHACNNACIITLTLFDTLDLYRDPYLSFTYSETALYASSLTYGLHLYHILMYIKKLRYDDWLHHGLMIFVALPIGNYFGPTKLLSHSMFYTTGLPGMVDYACLSLVRNKKMQRLTEKKINRYLNTYIRNPGCTIHAYITLIALMAYHTPTNIDTNITYEPTILNITIGLLSAAIVFWNGIYFMDQVVGNLYIEREKSKYTLPKDYNA